MSNEADDAWERWGAEHPYYGVLTEPRFRSDRLDAAAREDFFLSGELDAQHILNTIRRYGEPDILPARVLDFGCGVGRLALAFAGRVQSVVGVDISPSMLDEARRNAAARGIDNVTWIRSDDRLSALEGEFDLVYSHIVLQHIEPARGRALFHELARRVRPSGWGMIHVTFAWTAYDETFGRVPPPEPPRPPDPPSLRSRLRKVIVPEVGTEPAPAEAETQDPPMNMYFHDLNDLFYVLHRLGVTHVHTEFVDHLGVVGANLTFRAAC